MHELRHSADLGRREIVLLVAALMGLSAISVDIMLAALPEMASALHAAAPNLAQLAIGTFLLGAAGSALLVGPVADRFGRRLPILAGLTLFVLAALLTPLAPNLESLLALRLLQGLGVGTTRLSQAVLRDRFAGNDMAEVMSMSLVLFLLLPVVAPLAGQVIVLAAGWQAIFLTMGGLGAAVLAWTWFRLPETLAVANRRKLSPVAIGAGLRIVLGDRHAVGYGLAGMFLLAALYGFISSAQQVYGEAFGLGAFFPLAMGGTAVVQSAAAFLCARLIRRIGAARVADLSLTAYTALAAILVLAFVCQLLSVALFFVLMTALMAMFTWADATLGALSMLRLGTVAGTAASAFGALQALGATILGALVGQGYDGTPRALVWGTLLLGAAALASTVWGQRGR